jgi:transposase
MYQKLSDEQWSEIAPVIGRPGGKLGRPRLDNRNVLDAILWVLQSGNIWDRVPSAFASSSTAQRRYREWVESGTWSHIWAAYVRTLGASEADDSADSASPLNAWMTAMTSGRLMAIRVGTAVRVPGVLEDET